MIASLDEALREIRRLAEEGAVVAEGKARGQVRNLCYSRDDLCDAVWAAAENQCDWIAAPKFEETSHWRPPGEVVTLRVRFYRESDGDDDDTGSHTDSARASDALFLELKVLDDRIVVLAFKLDGSPQ